MDLLFEALSEDYYVFTFEDNLSSVKKKRLYKTLIFNAKDSDARPIIEKVQPQYVCNSEYHKKGDHGHQVNSGIDLPTFRFMTEKNISFLVDCGKLFALLEENKANPILARVRQNIQLAKKANTSILYISGSKKLTSEEIKTVKQTLQ